MINDDAVVITGLGLVTPIGIGKETVWKALVTGVNGIARLTRFDTSGFRTHCGGEVRDFHPHRYCRKVNADKLGPGAQLAVAAARLAVEDSGVSLASYPAERISVVLGTTMGESPIAEHLDGCQASENTGKLRANGFYLQYPYEMIPYGVAREFDLQGPMSMISTACAAGNYAIGNGVELLQLGVIDVALVGAVDPLSRVAFAGFNSMMAVSPEICQPFDRGRKGLAVSEGAGILVLERYADARRRGAWIYASVTGFGIANDAYHMTAPHPQGRGAVRSMQQALCTARRNVGEIDYISAHGTGTPSNDRTETLAIKTVFGPYAQNVPVSSIKSMMGHTMGAASAIEAAACCLVLQHGILPPTINYREHDPECDLDCVPNVARQKKVTRILSNSFAFGGNCAALVLEAV
jgi:3-oxoacyl-[acyl-carrier-protein] synthase II